jgi:hypothetical protein
MARDELNCPGFVQPVRSNSCRSGLVHRKPVRVRRPYALIDVIEQRSNTNTRSSCSVGCSIHSIRQENGMKTKLHTAGLMFQTVLVGLAWARFWKRNKEVLEAWLAELEAGLTPEERQQLEALNKFIEDGSEWERRLSVIHLFVRRSGIDS